MKIVDNEQEDGVRLLDARAFFYHFATMVAPAMALQAAGAAWKTSWPRWI